MKVGLMYIYKQCHHRRMYEENEIKTTIDKKSLISYQRGIEEGQTIH